MCVLGSDAGAGHRGVEEGGGGQPGLREDGACVCLCVSVCVYVCVWDQIHRSQSIVQSPVVLEEVNRSGRGRWSYWLSVSTLTLKSALLLTKVHI